MKKILYALSILMPLLWIPLGLANPDPEIKKLMEIKRCHVVTAEGFTAYKYISEYWLTNEKSNFHLQKNFEQVRKQHKKYFEVVNKFVSDNLDVPTNLTDIQAKINFLDSRHEELARELYDVAFLDETFMVSLAQIESGLNRARGDFVRASNICEGSIKSSLKLAIEDIEAWEKQLGKFRIFMNEAKRKRSSLFQMAVNGLKVRLLEKYAAISNERLENLLAKINGILEVDSLYAELENWWFRAALAKGLGRGFVNPYLQYEVPLRLMRIDLLEGENLYKKILATTAPEGIKGVVKKQAEAYLGTIKEQLKSLEDGDWMGVFERQKFMARKRYEIISEYVPECKPAIENYFKVEKVVSSKESFKLAEKAYIILIDSCKGKNK